MSVPMIPKRSLIMNGAGAGKGQSNLIALLENGEVVASCILAGRGAAERFAPTVQALLHDVGWDAPPDMVAAVVGPGSFTGLRASLSLASGLACGWSCCCIGVRLGDAVRKTVQMSDVSVVCLARRGRVFVDPCQGSPYALSVDDAPEKLSSYSFVAGDAVYGDDALLEFSMWNDQTSPRKVACAVPSAVGIFRAALSCAPLPLMPLYIDPPEAKPPAGGLRPAPVR